MNKKLLAIFLIACLTSSCFLTSCSKDSEAEPLEEAVEETMEEAVEEAVEETPEIEEEAEITTTPEQQLTEGDTSGADSTGVDGEFEEDEYRGDEEATELDIEALDQHLIDMFMEDYENGEITKEELNKILEELASLNEDVSTSNTQDTGGGTNQNLQPVHNTSEADAMLQEEGPGEEIVFGQGDYSSTRGGRVY